MESTTNLLQRIRTCTICEHKLADGVRPVLQFDSRAKILIAGQAPGRKVHLSGIPFDDASGDRLRSWLGVSAEQFYDPSLFAILPMGFCFPGTGKSGDLAPRPECANAWRAELMARMPALQLTLVIGRYALDYHFNNPGKVTEMVAAWETHPKDLMALPHPSGRNNIWLKKNAWFDAQVLPELKRRVRRAVLE